MSQKILLIDGHGLVYRAFYAFINNPLRTQEGKNISGVYGFFNTLFSLINTYKPDGVGVAFDSPWPTIRHEIYEAYKGQRESAPEELYQQFPLIKEILEAMEIPIFQKDKYEADDLLGSLAKSQKKRGNKVLIYTGDKDLLQLVEDDVFVLRPGFKGALRMYDADTVKEVLGVRPDQVVDYLAMQGDASDNVPGIPGVGKKTAAQYLEKYGTMENLYEHRDELTPKKKEKLEAGWQSGILSKTLVSLILNLAVEEDFAAPIQYPAALPLFEKISAPALIKQVKAFISVAQWEDGVGEAFESHASSAHDSHSAPTSGSAGADVSGHGATRQVATGFGHVTGHGLSDSAGTVAGESALGFHKFIPDPGVWVSSAEELASLVEELAAAEMLLIDFLIDGDNPMTADIVGLSLASESCPGLFVPLAPDSSASASSASTGAYADTTPNTQELKFGGEGLSAQDVASVLEPLCATAYGGNGSASPSAGPKLVGHNLSFQMKMLRRLGITPPKPTFDITVAAWILGDIDQYAIESLVKFYLKHHSLTYRDLRKEARLRELSMQKIADYMAIRSGGGVKLVALLKKALAQGGLDAIFYKLEMPVVSILSDMEYRGIFVDSEILATESEELSTELLAIKSEIFRLCGKEFNLNSPKQLQEVLFTERGLKPLRKTKTGYSTDTAVLEALALQDPVANYMVRYRVVSKLLSTYLEALPLLRVPATDRIHTTFVQTGTVTGRLSSRNPNLQNIPIRTDEGRRVRRAFTATQGHMLISADYAQIELALLAHLSGDLGLKEAFQRGDDIHATTGGLIFGVTPDQVTPEQRRIAKTINFGVMYGMSPFRLSREIGIPMSDAKTFINAYFEQYQGVKAFFDTTIQEVRERGIVETIRGRHRKVIGLDSHNSVQRSAAERIAINTRIQGSAADVVKEAMIQLDTWIQQGAVHGQLITTERPNMLLQVHDELLFETPKVHAQNHALEIQRLMEQAVELSVPLRVSVEVGSSWGDFH